MYFTLVLSSLGIILQLATAVLVRVEQGLLRGELNRTVTGKSLFYRFKGIPYAAPPVGELRFKAPRPALTWRGIRNATEHGNVCPQFEDLRNIFIPGSEDCLFLNVYTSCLDPIPLLPVIFVIQSGGLKWGSGNDDIYGPDFLIDERDVVVVTFNHRVDNLGFLCLDTADVPGNAGMKDQVAALRWVQRNIKNFGGDPDKVTILGQSAGSFSGLFHSVSPMSRGLFHRVIAMSGVPILDFLFEFEQQRRAFVLGKSLGYEATNTTALLKFLQSVPATRLINTNSTIVAAEDYMTVKILLNVPVVEKDFGQERFLIEPIEVSIKKRRMKVDLLMGHTTAEGIFFIPEIIRLSSIEKAARFPEVLVPRNIYYQTTPRRHLKLSDYIRQFYTGSKLRYLESMSQFVNYLTDDFIYYVLKYAELLSNFNSNDNIYLYEFAIISERNVLTPVGRRYGITGISHFDDLNYVFNTKLFNLTLNMNANSYIMIRRMCALFTNFALHGNPTPDAALGIMWPKYNNNSKKYLTIAQELTIGTDPNQETVDFYDFIHKVAGIKI